MPGYKSHITAALFFCGLLYLFPFWLPMSIWEKAGCVALAVFFGLWPDVDIKSKGQTVFLIGFVILDTVLILRHEYEKAAYLGLIIVLPIVGRHRGWTHSVGGMLLVTGGLYIAAIQYSGLSPMALLPYFIAALLGYVSHLILDRFF